MGAIPTSTPLNCLIKHEILYEGGPLTMIRFTADEFINKYQHEDIIKALAPEITDAFIDDVCEQVIDYCRSQSPSFNADTLSEWQQEQLKRAQMEQAITVLTYGRESPLAPKTIGILKRAGFLYKGLR